MDFWKEILGFISEYRFYIIGGILGFVISILMLTIGFFPTLLILIFTSCGAVLMGDSSVRIKLTAWFGGVFDRISSRFKNR